MQHPAREPAQAPGLRRVIHIDMDAFFASVEQRDDPGLRGRPVFIASKRVREPTAMPWARTMGPISWQMSTSAR